MVVDLSFSRQPQFLNRKLLAISGSETSEISMKESSMCSRRVAGRLCLCCAALSCFFRCGPAAGQSAVASRQSGQVSVQGEIALEQSRVYIHVGKSGFGHEHAVAGMLRAGHIHLGAEQNAGELVFEMASFVADPDYARKFVGLEGISDPDTQQKVTANMLGPDVLDVAQYPIAEFRIASAKATETKSQRGLGIYEFAGEFSLHGTTKPIRFRAEVEQLDGRSRILGSFTIRQTDFGMTPYTKAFGTIGVADQLRIYGDLYVVNREATATGDPK
jgi:YceI-like domain